MQKDLQHQVKNLTDVPMMTAYHRQAAQLAKYSHYETVNDNMALWENPYFGIEQNSYITCAYAVMLSFYCLDPYIKLIIFNASYSRQYSLIGCTLIEESLCVQLLGLKKKYWLLP